MTAQPPTEDFGIDYSTLGTLKQLALVGGFRQGTTVSLSALASKLETPKGTTRERLQALERTGLISLRQDGAEQHILVTDRGRRVLRDEYEALRRLCGSKSDVELEGTVTAGINEGAYFISLDGYREQFVAGLGYEPFPGTLNVKVDADSVESNPWVGRCDAIHIESWVNEKKRTFGPARCYPVTIRTEEVEYEPAHVIQPERSSYGDDTMEVIAPEKLRDVLELETGSRVTICVPEVRPAPK